MRRSFPADYGTRGCVLVPIDMSLLPIVAGLLQPLEEERAWLSEDYESAYKAIAALEACMAVTCLDDLIESNAQIYRLLDSAFYGRVYAAGAAPPATILPAIPTIPNLDFANPGLLGKVEYLSQAFQSMIGGVDTPNFSGTPNVHALLQAIIDSASSDDVELADIISKLEIIAALLA